MPSHLTRRHVLLSAAATAAVAAMPAGVAIAAVEQAPRMAGWAFVANEMTEPLLTSLPIDTMAKNYVGFLFALIDASKRASIASGPHTWRPVTIVNGKLRIVGDKSGSYRTACIDAGWKLEALS